ncbi:MAG: hypothetical protein ACREQ3_25600, partial [Candidatus Binatia bacterium]
MNDDPVLAKLTALLDEPSVKRKLAPMLARVENALASRPDEPQSWEPVALDLFGIALPNSIKSCWVFVLRADALFGAERHPNSHQRTVALSGSAMFEVFQDHA